ncbi:uncharacterized protein TNCV_1386571 [Trichonephila clavipes]|nr:uncharacterized protein TNCV_1386571 [Trichonephila clavipes]
MTGEHLFDCPAPFHVLSQDNCGVLSPASATSALYWTARRLMSERTTKEGKYVVSMPLKKEPSCLGYSKDIALTRLGSLWNHLARDKNYLNLYREFLRDYERLGHMMEVTNETDPEITYYATHHGIYRPEKSTTKLRVVFNCSSLTDNGISK